MSDAAFFLYPAVCLQNYSSEKYTVFDSEKYTVFDSEKYKIKALRRSKCCVAHNGCITSITNIINAIHVMITISNIVFNFYQTDIH